MENEINKHNEGLNVEKGASIHSFRSEEHELRRSNDQKKRAKHIHTPGKNNNDEAPDESSQIKPFINMYDPFG